MPSSDALLPCPFCHGQGKMPRVEIVSRLEDPELPDKIVAELSRSEAGSEAVPAGVQAKAAAAPGEFATKVHGWNKHVLWRRSSKE